VTASSFQLGSRPVLLAGFLAALAVGITACSGGSPQPVPHAPTAQHRHEPIALSSLHGRITFTHGDDVWVADADGTHPRRLTRRPGPELDPSWSPDGKRIVYRDSRRGINQNDEIYVIGANGRQAHNLTRSPNNEWSPSWSPDGKLIAFYSGELYVMRPDGSGPHAITTIEGEYPAWSPDGARLAFMSAEPDARGSNPNYDVFVVGRDGKGLRQLTDWPGEDGWPAWSPDGKWIVFNSTYPTNEPGRRLLYVMRSDGSDKHVLVSTISASYPVWSPDGKAIMFSGSPGESTDSDHLWVVRPDGTGLRKLPLIGWLPDWHEP
jgi:TolB protein